MTFVRFVLDQPRVVEAGIAIDRVAPIAWLGLQVAALTPHWLGLVRGLGQGAGDLPGLFALAALVAFGWSRRRVLRATPHLGWLGAAGLGVLLAMALQAGFGVHFDAAEREPEVAGVLALLALACGWTAFLPKVVAAAPVAGLFANRFVHRAVHKTVFGLAMLLCLAWAAAAR